jgi:hypothetical protein
MTLREGFLDLDLVWSSEEQAGSENHSLRPQADFFAGTGNSITFPRCSGGSHFTRFENVDGM